MDDQRITARPAALDAIHEDAAAIGFGMSSEPRTGAMLRAIAASKPAGRFLELGTGAGVSTAWLLAGMDAKSRLTSVDNDPTAQDVARRRLGGDARVIFTLADGAEFLAALPARRFDLVWADTWPGKFSHVDEALRLLKVGGVYLVDDLLPQPNWPDGHASRIEPLISDLEARPGFVAVKLAWASGLLMLVRTRQK